MEKKQDLLLSVADLSRCLGVTSWTIQRWIAQGKLPCSLKDGHFLFRKTELEKWAARHKIILDVSPGGNETCSEPSRVCLAEAVRAGGLYKGIQGSHPEHTPEHTLTAFVERLSTIPEDFKDDLLVRLIERQNAISTGIGNGVALPHPCEPLGYLSSPMVPVFVLDEPVPYNAIYNRPVSVLCLILAPTLRIHLTLLSSISFYLRDRTFTECLKSGPSLDRLAAEIEARDTGGIG